MKTFHLMPPLPPGKTGDAGIIGPDTLYWTIASERMLVLGGLSAVLLQVAHPMVGAGVADHSHFRDDPLRRLVGTMHAVLVTTFGDHDQAQQMAQRIAGIHGPVHGDLNGNAYSAFNPELCLWVYATLVEVALDTYSLFFRKLSDDERARYYEETKPFGRLFCVTEAVIPRTYEEFKAYYRRELTNLTVDERALSIAESIFKAKLNGIPVSPLGRLVAAGLLPTDRIRAAYGLSWNLTYRIAWRIFVAVVRFIVRITPPPVRRWRHYGVAIRRVAAA
jgi:uncharacterized protein (DUF2236 family)